MTPKSPALVRRLALSAFLATAACLTSPTHAQPTVRLPGTPVSWGGDFLGQVSSTPAHHDLIAVAAGLGHGVGLRAGRGLIAWGADDAGQVSDTPTGQDFVQLTAGAQHSVALRADGTLVAWGADLFGAVSQTPLDDGFVKVAAGFAHNLALRADGSLLSWGSNFSGLVTSTPSGNGFIDIAGGFAHSVAIERLRRPTASPEAAVADAGTPGPGSETARPPGTVQARSQLAPADRSPRPASADHEPSPTRGPR